MTLFVDLRATGIGGVVADAARAWEDGTTPLSAQAFDERVKGRDVLFAVHGFNVDRQRGIEALTMWAQRCALPAASVFVGVLWPGDAKLHVFVDYV